MEGSYLYNAPMRNRAFLVILLLHLGFSALAHAADEVDAVKKAIERGTLNQPGTKPFHLKAVLTPSLEGDKDSGRTGEVEIWWKSPTEWKREVRCADFHQVAIFNGSQEWQKNEGEYFPEWLRNIAVELVEPVPHVDEVLEHVNGAQHVGFSGVMHLSWMFMASNGDVQKGIGAGIDISAQSGLLNYASGLGWGAAFSEYKNFHGRMVAMKVEAGTPQVTARVELEDLGVISADTFGASTGDSDRILIKTAIVNELQLRKNLINGDPTDWPPVKDGPLEGLLTMEIVVDRSGNVRDVGSVLSDNPAVSETASKAIWGRHFRPYLLNGQPVQVVSTFTLPFKTARPPGVETFESALTYFERGRNSFPAYSDKSQPYTLRAIFKARLKSGNVEEGLYVDTFKSSAEWRREATAGKSRYVRSQRGQKRYELAEGPDAPLLRMVLEFAEPMFPPLNAFFEADWRIKRDSVASVNCIRLAAGYESPSGDPDPEQFRGFWFDPDGNLIKTYLRGVETRRSNFSPFAGFQFAKEIQVLQNKALVMLIRVNEVASAVDLPDSSFEIKGHAAGTAFTEFR